MKKIFILILFCVVSVVAISQNYGTNYAKFLPSNLNSSDLNPSDIPSEQVLRQMGFSEDEIKEALDFKHGKELNFENNIDSNFGISNNNVKKTINSKILKDSLFFPKAKIYGQDIFRTNKVNFYQKATNPNAPNNYEIGPGDKLSIAVWGNSDYTAVVKVDQGGYISPDGFGRIYVKGLTFKEAKSLIKNKLGMNYSEMDISLIYSRVIVVNIVGEVYSPGSYAIPAINTAFNALMAANGPTQIGSVRNIYIKRNGNIVDSLDVYKFLFDPTNHKDIYLQDGDYILVSSAGNLVEVKGEVNRPYTYEFKNSDNLKDLIKYAGGYTTEASKNIITLKRFENENLLLHDVHNKDLSTTKLKSADEIIVNKIQRKISNFVSLEGGVGVEGDYEFVKGEKILDLLKRANCLNEYLYSERAYVLRKLNDGTIKSITIDLGMALSNFESQSNIELKEYDIVKVMSIDDFNDNYFISVFGSVRKPQELIFGKGMKLSEAIELSGGFKLEAGGSRVEVSRVLDLDSKNLTPKRSLVLVAEIKPDLSLSSENSNFILQNNDQIFVRKNPEYEDPINITINGEVVYPGTYSILTNGDRVSDLIQRCGGVTKNAFLEGTRIYRKTKIMQQEIFGQVLSEEFKEAILSDTSLYNLYSDDLINSELIKHSSLEEIDEYEYTIVYFDMKKALKNNPNHNIVLLESDSLVIPKSTDVIYVTGSLYNFQNGTGISIPFLGNKRADYYINNFAGGYSKLNDKSRTTVISANGSVKKSINLGLLSISPKVTKGSTIKLMPKEQHSKSKSIPIDWNEAIENTLVKVTGVMSLYLLINRIQGSF